MNKLKEFLAEGRRSASLNLEHIDDQIWIRGAEGARDSVYFLRGLRSMLAGHVDQAVHVATQWDGAPDIVVGTNPDNGKFFISTRENFPKVAYTEAQIDSHYSSPLSNKLKIAFKYLKDLKIEAVLGGHIMFTPGDLKHEFIDGVEHVTFTPNRTTYAVPADSNLASKINRAKVGVVFDTEYKGWVLDSLKPSYNPHIANLTPSQDVWARDSTFIDSSGTVTFTERETQLMNAYLESAANVYNRIDQKVIDYIAQNDKIRRQIMSFIDREYKTGSWSTTTPSDKMARLLNYITISLNQDIIDSKKSDTMRKREIEKRDVLGFYTKNYAALTDAFLFMSIIAAAKEMVLAKLKTIKSMGFTKTAAGFKVANPDGFIAIDHTGKAVKLADRLEFSKGLNTTTNWE
jgi:hypothetical protein